jgi:hypothetical protein
MSLSDRLSHRVVESAENDLDRAAKATISGADDGASLVHPQRRVGARRLDEIAQALSVQDMTVLRSIGELHYLTTRHVQRLHFDHSTRNSLAAARAASRCLERLHSIQLVDRLERRVGGVRAGSASYVVGISPIGARLLEASTRRRSREPSRLHLDHVMQVSELVVQLHEAKRQHRVDLITADVEPVCWRPFVAPHGARGLLKPDARVAVAIDEVERHWFVEVDRGSEHAPVLRRKMQTYVDAWRAGVEQADTPFPQVLWLVPDERRGDAIEAALSRMPALPPGMTAIATFGNAVSVICGGQR